MYYTISGKGLEHQVFCYSCRGWGGREGKGEGGRGEVVGGGREREGEGVGRGGPGTNPPWIPRDNCIWMYIFLSFLKNSNYHTFLLFLFPLPYFCWTD